MSVNRSYDCHKGFEFLLKYIKWIVHPKMKILSIGYLLTLMLFQPRKTFVHLRNMN